MFEKYKTNIDDVGGKRRYSRNILQWCKNDFKSKNNTNGDYLNEQMYHESLPEKSRKTVYDVAVN